jgi:hypothetical protein
MPNACCGTAFAIVDFAALNSDGNIRSALISRILHRRSVDWSWSSMVGSMLSEHHTIRREPPA